MLFLSSPAERQQQFNWLAICAWASILACRISLRWMRDARQDWSVASYTHFLDDRSFGSLDFDLLANHLCIFPLTHILVLIGILRIEFFNIQVFDVRDGISKAPGNILVMSNYNSRSAWKTYSNYIDITSCQVTLIPD